MDMAVKEGEVNFLHIPSAVTGVSCENEGWE